MTVEELAAQVDSGALSVEEAAPQIVALIRASPASEPRTHEQKVIDFTIGNDDLSVGKNSRTAFEATVFEFQNPDKFWELRRAVSGLIFNE